MKSRGEFAAYPSAYPAPTSAAQFGMTLTEYFMAHAPAEPQPWFRKLYSPKDEKQCLLQWPHAWAREQITILDNLI